MTAQQDRWPNLFVVGAAKAGTTALWSCLAGHPDVFMAAVKEPHFFAPSETTIPRKIEAEDDYLRLFRRAHDERYLGEASPSYLWEPSAPTEIRRRSPSARVVITLRDPVERAYSAYLHAARSTERRSFLETIEHELASPTPCPSQCVGRSFYADSVERYLAAFGPQTHVLFFEEFRADPRRELRRLLVFLGLDPDAANAAVVAGARNGRAVPRNVVARAFLGSPRARAVARKIVPLALTPSVEALLLGPAPEAPIDPRARAILTEVFADDVERVADLLARAVPW